MKESSYQAFYHLLFDHAKFGIITCDFEGKIHDVNPFFCDLVSYGKEELLGTDVTRLLDPGDLVSHPPAIGEIMQGATIQHDRRVRNKLGVYNLYEIHAQKLDAEKVLILVHDISARQEALRLSEEKYRTRVAATSLKDEEGHFLGSFAFFTDITTAKDREETIARLAEMVDNAPNSITIHGLDGTFLYANRKTFELHQYTAEEFSSINLHQLDVPDSEALINERIRRIQMEGFAQFQVRHYRKDGSTFPLEVFVKMVDWKGIPALLSIATDITERERFMNDLRNSEERFRLAFTTSPDAVNINELQTGLYLDVNEGFCNITGYERAEVIGRTAYEINIWAHVEDRARLVEILSREKKVVNFETVFRFKDGRLRTGLMSASIIMLNGVPHIISISRDIEELKEAEKKIMQAKEAAEEASMLKTAFLNNISHEVRTPMNSILGFTDLLQSDEFDQPEKDRFIGIIQSNGKQLLSIIDDVLEISRLDSGRIPLNPVTFHLHELLEDLHLSMKDVFVKKGLQFQYSFNDQGLGDLVIADREKIRQIIAGFIGNAVKFTQHGMVSFGYTRNAAEIEFFVRDTGIGIPAAEHQRIFERFYQIQSESVAGSRGTGLGLSIARGLADFMKGSIRIDSVPGQGSTFFLTIPYEEPRVQTDKPVSEVHFSLQDLTILVAEDEDYNYELVEIMLGRKARRMIRARNGEETLSMLAGECPDIILMDLKMPVMDGYEATRRLRESHPDLPVIALTAYTQPEEEQKAMQAGCDAFICKPIKKQSLIEVIRRTVIRSAS